MITFKKFMKISDINARKILSSTGSETVEARIVVENGGEMTASVPAGISAGKYEAIKSSPEEAVRQIMEIKEKLINKDLSQEELDRQLIVLKLAGNASLAVSVAWWKAEKRLAKQNLSYQKFPLLMALMFEGGKHGNPEIGMQEFLMIEETVNQAVSDYKLLADYLRQVKIPSTVGAEGGFSPLGFDNLKILEVLKKIFPDKNLALDAAGSFSDENANWKNLLENYRIISVEDPYSDEEWEKWKYFYTEFGNKIMVVGDDLTVTNPERLSRALNPKVINAIIIKPNQNGTITGTLNTVQLAREQGLAIIVSHRGEETNDDWIADLALDVQADYVKFGGLDRGERIAKYNRLRELGMN